MARASSGLLKRRLDIAETVRKQGEVKVDELSALLGVSGVTIRQDLTYLEQQGYLKRSFGGAIYIAPEATNYNHKVVSKTIANSVDNSDIDLVQHCLAYINDGDTLFLGHGRLIRKLIPYLYDKKSLTLLVNDLAHAQLVKEFTQAEVIMVGGVLTENDVTIDNQLLMTVLNQYDISLLIIEICAINADNELIIDNVELMKYYQLLLKNTLRSIAILPLRMVHNESNHIGKLDNVDVAILSRPAVTEYHQQLLDNQFIQVSSSKRNIIYKNTVEA